MSAPGLLGERRLSRLWSLPVRRRIWRSGMSSGSGRLLPGAVLRSWRMSGGRDVRMPRGLHRRRVRRSHRRALCWLPQPLLGPRAMRGSQWLRVRRRLCRRGLRARRAGSGVRWLSVCLLGPWQVPCGRHMPMLRRICRRWMRETHRRRRLPCRLLGSRVVRAKRCMPMRRRLRWRRVRSRHSCRRVRRQLLGPWSMRGPCAHDHIRERGWRLAWDWDGVAANGGAVRVHSRGALLVERPQLRPAADAAWMRAWLLRPRHVRPDSRSSNSRPVCVRVGIWRRGLLSGAPLPRSVLGAW